MMTEKESGERENRFPPERASLVLTVGNVALELASILKIFEDHAVRVIHVESRRSRDAAENMSEILLELEMNANNTKFQTIADQLRKKLLDPTMLNVISGPSEKFSKSRSLDRSDTKYTPDGMPWFPKSVAELDECSNRVLMYGADLDADHPGFKDEAYRKRRIEFAEIAYNYRYGQPIPRVKYNDVEIKTWSTIFTELTKLYPTHACQEYLRNFPLLQKHCGYSVDNIPQLEDISNYLCEKTGFRLRPVAGYLSSRDFLAGLAFRVFHCTQYIRHSSDPFYTPEPDCCHEILGHMPLFLDPSFAEFSQQIGIASLGVSDEEVQKLATCYFFTIEFGLCKQNGEMRVYGAGLLSSIGELKHVLSGSAVHKPFDVATVCQTECMITTFQNAYFYSESFEEAKEKLRNFSKTIKRTFELKYDSYTQSVHVLDNPRTIAKAIDDIEDQLCVVSKALKKLNR